MGDFVAEAGGAALGGRLRRLSAAIDADAARVYAAHGVRFEQRWFGVMNQLATFGPMSVRQLADALGISHASISETRQSLQKAGLIVAENDAADGRRRLLALSSAGQALVTQLTPLWNAFDEAARQLDSEAGEVTQALSRLEQALAAKPLRQRITELIGSPPRQAGG
jgi:MarR family transcriptional regulator, organic hydroperoxide resistance regulator